MKKIFLIAFITILGFATKAEAQINWMNMNQALEAQKKNKKPIFLDAYTNWCGPCKMLDKQTFSNETFAAYINKNYNPVKFNAEGNEEIQFNGKLYKNPRYQESRKNSRNSVHDFTLAIGVKAYPTMIVIDQKGKITQNIMGVRSAEDLMNLLQ